MKKIIAFSITILTLTSSSNSLCMFTRLLKTQSHPHMSRSFTRGPDKPKSTLLQWKKIAKAAQQQDLIIERLLSHQDHIANLQKKLDYAAMLGLFNALDDGKRTDDERMELTEQFNQLYNGDTSPTAPKIEIDLSLEGLKKLNDSIKKDLKSFTQSTADTYKLAYDNKGPSCEKNYHL